MFFFSFQQLEMCRESVDDHIMCLAEPKENLTAVENMLSDMTLLDQLANEITSIKSEVIFFRFFLILSQKFYLKLYLILIQNFRLLSWSLNLKQLV